MADPFASLSSFNKPKTNNVPIGQMATASKQHSISSSTKPPAQVPAALPHSSSFTTTGLDYLAGTAKSSSSVGSSSAITPFIPVSGVQPILHQNRHHKPFNGAINNGSINGLDSLFSSVTSAGATSSSNGAPNSIHDDILGLGTPSVPAAVNSGSDNLLNFGDAPVSSGSGILMI